MSHTRGSSHVNRFDCSRRRERPGRVATRGIGSHDRQEVDGGGRVLPWGVHRGPWSRLGASTLVDSLAYGSRSLRPTRGPGTPRSFPPAPQCLVVGPAPPLPPPSPPQPLRLYQWHWALPHRRLPRYDPEKSLSDGPSDAALGPERTPLRRLSPPLSPTCSCRFRCVDPGGR